MDRRDFLKAFGIAGGTLIAGNRNLSASETSEETEFMGILVDTTRCEGCRTCEMICAETNDLPEPDWEVDILETERRTSETQFTLVNGYETEKGEVYVKRQCMHCTQPACASACLTKAMLKTREGPVIWQANKCMGCRYCMISCPFDIPKFEHHSANPRIRKCSMCWARLKEGEQPACAENCPAEAVLFGKRRDLLEIAKSRIYQDPDNYNHHIYGEHEVGGTGYLYLASVPFEQLGFLTNLENRPVPELTTDFLYGVPIILTLWPAFLLALSNSTKSKVDSTESEV
jgi:Fe-S-cluster-containing dehydrogenase component